MVGFKILRYALKRPKLIIPDKDKKKLISLGYIQ